MAAYTIQEFITRAVAGNGVSLSASPAVNVVIDGTPLTISSPIDIGQFFSARQVLESYQIRAGIVAGSIASGAGTTSLSITKSIT